MGEMRSHTISHATVCLGMALAHFDPAIYRPTPRFLPLPQVLGDLELIDQGELDHKIIAIDAADPMAAKINSIADLKVRGRARARARARG